MSYIRIIRTNNGVRYFTSDNKSHKKLNDVIKYIIKNINNLEDTSINFDIIYNRKKKLDVIMSKM